MTPPAPGRDRLHSLDGLRGFAALFVVFFHTFDYVQVGPQVRSAVLSSPLGILVNGPGAVHLFFVLSGFVLALTLGRDSSPAGVGRYYVRRIFRIHAPYVAGVLFAWLASFVYADPAIVGGEPGPLPRVHLRPDQFPLALAFPSMAFGQLPVGWSLYVELAMSLVFPLLLLFARRVHPLALLFAALLVLSPPSYWVGFLAFTIDFALGIVLFLEQDRVRGWFARLSPPLDWTPLLAGLLLLQAPYAIAWRSTGTARLLRGHDPTVVLLMGIGAALLVSSAQHHAATRGICSTRSARFLGRVSYSLYLVHVPVLLVLTAWGGHASAASAPLLFAAVAAGSIGFAWLGYHGVERPSIHAGRALSRRIRIRASG